MNPTTAKFATLMGSASFLTMAGALSAQAQQVAQAQTAQAQEVPEQVLITGSLIHGTAAVGVPVTNLGVQDFRTTGAATTADLFRTVPQANVSPGAVATNSGGHLERETRVNIRGLDQTGPRSLMMIDGMRFPPQADGICAIDPSIIPSIALDRIDILADGASATYGSDAIAGVINIVLKRAFDGAVTQLNFQAPDSGGLHYQASQLWGRTWDGGDITLSYEWYDEAPVYGTAHSKYTANYSPWGLDNENPLAGSLPGTITTGGTQIPAAYNSPAFGSSNPYVKFGTICTNCFAIPKGTGVPFNPINGGLGPVAPSSAATLNWATFGVPANGGTANEFDTLDTGYEVAPQQRNAATMTVDQRLTKGVSFFGEGFYSNRRVQQHVAGAVQPVTNNLLTVAVPTINPYYPTNAPGNLRVNYDIGIEIPTFVNAYETSSRYAFGLNIDLPGGWTGQVYDSRSYDSNVQYHTGTVNKNAVSAALGWTIPASAASGTTPGIATWTKPGAVPYLNLFCDPTTIQCNSPTTLSYVTGYRRLTEQFWVDEKGAKFDGPLFDLPAGQVKAAVGANYTSFDVTFVRLNTTGGSLLQPMSVDPEPYNVWAGFAQVNIPVFGDAFNFPLFRRLDLEASWRHDQYHGTLVGGTSNPKFGFTWNLSQDLGATVRGSWGTSFRFANAGEYSVIASSSVQDYGLPNSGFGAIAINCLGGAPPAGTAAAKLFATGLFGCGTQPGGLSYGGAPHTLVRFYTDPTTGQTVSREGGITLPPEKSANYSIGGELAPQISFLKGLDVQATWYSVKINGVLTGFNNPNSSSLNDPNQNFHFILPSDLGCPVAANANPVACAPFELMVAGILADSNNTTAPVTAQTSIYWINDGGTVAQGFIKVQGVDWQASYDWDMGDLGAWNTGITGTYYLHRNFASVNGGPITDAYHQNLSALGGIPQNGVETLPRMRYRARLGWSDGQWSVTGFMDYQSHYYHTQSAPPNVNLQCTTAGGTIGGGTFPCAISNYSNIQPSWYTFDLSFGYDTGDTPTNTYLKNIGVQLVVQNLMGRHPAFQYGPSNAGRGLAAYDILKPDLGRVWNITLTKTW
jgi:iron complex outermembrane receptor protein